MRWRPSAKRRAPEGLAEAVDAAVAAYFTERGRESRKATLRGVETRLARLRDLYELGHVTRDDYLARHAELETERGTLATSMPRPLFFRQQTCCVRSSTIGRT